MDSDKKVVNEELNQYNTWIRFENLGFTVQSCEITLGERAKSFFLHTCPTVLEFIHFWGGQLLIYTDGPSRREARVRSRGASHLLACRTQGLAGRVQGLGSRGYRVEPFLKIVVVKSLNHLRTLVHLVIYDFE